MIVGILHPGAMGVSVARSVRDGGHEVLWACDGRSAASKERAIEHGLVDVGSLSAVCDKSEIILSVCPPEAASDVANDVAEAGFEGIFVDANAISPKRMMAIDTTLTAAGISVVDGGIIGLPAWKANGTWLYLSGPDAAVVADCAGAGLLETEVVGSEIGKASALKMCYAALSKGTTALICAILGAADELGVRDELSSHWDRDEAGLAQVREMKMRGVTEKAWRYVAEMEEIAATFEAVGQTDGFHKAAADVYRRLSPLKEGPHPSDYDTVIAAMKGRLRDDLSNR